MSAERRGAVDQPIDGHPKEPPRWLDESRNVQRIVQILSGACALLVLADLAYHKHVHYDFEGWFGFYGFYGFVSCVVLVRAAVLMRRFLMRDEDYYEPVDDPLSADPSTSPASADGTHDHGSPFAESGPKTGRKTSTSHG